MESLTSRCVVSLWVRSRFLWPDFRATFWLLWTLGTFAFVVLGCTFSFGVPSFGFLLYILPRRTFQCWKKSANIPFCSFFQCMGGWGRKLCRSELCFQLAPLKLEFYIALISTLLSKVFPTPGEAVLSLVTHHLLTFVGVAHWEVQDFQLPIQVLRPYFCLPLPSAWSPHSLPWCPWGNSHFLL